MVIGGENERNRKLSVHSPFPLTSNQRHDHPRRRHSFYASMYTNTHLPTPRHIHSCTHNILTHTHIVYMYIFICTCMHVQLYISGSRLSDWGNGSIHSAGGGQFNMTSVSHVYFLVEGGQSL